MAPGDLRPLTRGRPAGVRRGPSALCRGRLLARPLPHHHDRVHHGRPGRDDVRQRSVGPPRGPRQNADRAHGHPRRAGRRLRSRWRHPRHQSARRAAALRARHERPAAAQRRLARPRHLPHLSGATARRDRRAVSRRRSRTMVRRRRALLAGMEPSRDGRSRGLVGRHRTGAHDALQHQRLRPRRSYRLRPQGLRDGPAAAGEGRRAERHQLPRRVVPRAAAQHRRAVAGRWRRLRGRRACYRADVVRARAEQQAEAGEPPTTPPAPSCRHVRTRRSAPPNARPHCRPTTPPSTWCAAASRRAHGRCSTGPSSHPEVSDRARELRAFVDRRSGATPTSRPARRATAPTARPLRW